MKVALGLLFSDLFSLVCYAYGMHVQMHVIQLVCVCPIDFLLKVLLLFLLFFKLIDFDKFQLFFTQFCC